jgi:hypothetical protein
MRGAETIVWAGGESRFRLGIGELRAIEQASDAGVAVVFMRLIGQQWKIDDVLGPIRLGLIGAGMSEGEARATINRVSALASPYSLAVTSAEVLRRFIMWGEEDAPGEHQAGTESPDPLPSQTAKPDGQATTEREPF